MQELSHPAWSVLMLCILQVIMVSIQSSVKLFSPQNAWSGGYIAGTRIGELASRQPVKGNSVKET